VQEYFPVHAAPRARNSNPVVLRIWVSAPV